MVLRAYAGSRRSASSTMTILDHGGFLPSIILVAGFAGFLRVVQTSLWQVALFSLPGTVAHESRAQARGCGYARSVAR